MISIFRANISYFETDFCRGFLFVISSYRSERHVLRNNYCSNTFTPPGIFFRIFNKLRIFTVPVFRCSGVPVFLVLLIAEFRSLYLSFSTNKHVDSSKLTESTSLHGGNPRYYCQIVQKSCKN